MLLIQEEKENHMSFKDVKKKLSDLFNSQAGAAIEAGTKGTATGMKLLDMAKNAGLISAAVPGVNAFLTGAAIVAAGGIVALTTFRKAQAKRLAP